MCYDDNARAPIPPGTHGQAHGEDLVLTAVDGNRFAAYIAQPEQPALAQVLIYPDIRGLHQFYKDLALRFAEAGITALALDYFGRSAGLTERNDAFDFWPHVKQLKISTFLADVSAALAYLKEGDGSKYATMVVGFCMGGSFALLTGMSDLDITGIICFYAGLSRSLSSGTTVLDEAEKVKRPTLGLFGGDDQGIPSLIAATLNMPMLVPMRGNRCFTSLRRIHPLLDKTVAPSLPGTMCLHQL
ncbi:MAG: dienelactone hydrolase family protein [Chloroflexi bacterium]|nr:MAG: dienelactone hydrolase family protein [Chloroflexota bacterium]